MARTKQTIKKSKGKPQGRLRLRELPPPPPLDPAGVFERVLGGCNNILTLTDRAGRRTSGAPLWWAAKSLHEEGEDAAALVRTLVDRGAEVNQPGGIEALGVSSTPLLEVVALVADHMAWEQVIELAKFLISKGAEVNVWAKLETLSDDLLECTPLWYAAWCVDYRGGCEIARLLLDNGADPNALGSEPGEYECTPVWFLALAFAEGKASAASVLTLAFEKGGKNTTGFAYGCSDSSSVLRWLAQAKRDSREGADSLVRLLVERGDDLLPGERAEWDPYLWRPLSKEVRYLREQEDSDSLDVPPAFLCPISREIMNDPVMASDGHTYERRSITVWLREKDTSPKTNAPLHNLDLTPNHTLRNAISEFAERCLLQ